MSGFADLLAPVGPVAEAFVKDQRFLAAIMGPLGSAKTTSCIRKIVFESPLWQDAAPDGVRYVRWAAVRATYPQLERNVLKSWFLWFEKNKACWNASTMTYTMRYELCDVATGVVHPVQFEMIFIALNDRSAEDVLPGLELTGLWINEVNTVPQDVWLIGAGRTGRYPPMKLGGCTWSGVICDFNAPDIDSWTYELLVQGNLGLDAAAEKKIKAIMGPRFGVGFHRQPGGRSTDPKPENIENLEHGYYAKAQMVYAKKPNLLRRLVDNEFGTVVDGQLVFPECNPDIHFTDEALKPLPDFPILAGLDGGRTPAMVFFQDAGYIRVLGELVVLDPRKLSNADKIFLDRIGPKHFGEMASKFVADNFGNREVEMVGYDPSIDFGVEEEWYDWLEVFKSEFPAKFIAGGETSNRIEPRLEAIRHWFNTSPGGRPGVLISRPKCPVLVRGLSGGYIFEQMKTSVGPELKSKPIKGPYSHVQDAWQHGVLGYNLRGKGLLAMRDRRDAGRAQGGNIQYSKKVQRLRAQGRV